jgi:hypothetical protein
LPTNNASAANMDLRFISAPWLVDQTSRQSSAATMDRISDA